MTSIRDLRDCRHYATLLCAKRIIMARQPGMPLTTLHVLEEPDYVVATVVAALAGADLVAS